MGDIWVFRVEDDGSERVYSLAFITTDPDEVGEAFDEAVSMR